MAVLEVGGVEFLAGLDVFFGPAEAFGELAVVEAQRGGRGRRGGGRVPDRAIRWSRFTKK